MLNIGQRITIKWLKEQIFPQWVVLVDLEYLPSGGVSGGVVKYIGSAKVLVGDEAVKLERKGIDTYVTRGAVGEVHVGEVFSN